MNQIDTPQTMTPLLEAQAEGALSSSLSSLWSWLVSTLTEQLWFLQSGVAFTIVATSFAMWILIGWRYFVAHQTDRFVNQPHCFADQNQLWHETIVQAGLSQVKVRLTQGEAELDLMIKLLPMLGLLGTVSGMVESFAQFDQQDVMTSVASGISQAMLTTLIGLLAALSGMYFAYRLKRQNRKLIARCQQQWFDSV